MNPYESKSKINSWVTNSVSLKLITIAFLMLLLMIPASMIKSVIGERENLNNQATQEVSAKWANRQTINGPMIAIPLVCEKTLEGKVLTSQKYLYLLPDKLKIDGEITPQKLRRGIYEIVVYNSQIKVTGDFTINIPDHIDNLKEIKYEQAFITLGISDLKGIKNEIELEWADKILEFEPGSKIPNLIPSGISFDISELESVVDKQVNFAFSIDLQGSQNLSFIPTGGITDVSLTSTWNSPSFMGNFLPDNREITPEGFQSTWKIFQLNRNYPQSWIDMDQSGPMLVSLFGVDLILPLDDYQKSMRSAKYAAMTIALTFLIFFLVEILNKRKIHPFQYILVGIGLCLFYILLVSISEHASFKLAYGISALAIISMISLYSLSVFKSKKLSLILILALSAIFGFLYITLQLSDYALLMGSVGLSVILAATMFFTRKLDWYNLSIDSD